CLLLPVRHPVHPHSFPTRRSSDLDAGNPDRVLLHMIQSGLGLPDESYYREEKFADIVEAYRTYIETLFLLSDIAPTEKRARKMRSEEHTSELQSRFDLVCRPVREK